MRTEMRRKDEKKGCGEGMSRREKGWGEGYIRSVRVTVSRELRCEDNVKSQNECVRVHHPGSVCVSLSPPLSLSLPLSLSPSLPFSLSLFVTLPIRSLVSLRFKIARI